MVEVPILEIAHSDASAFHPNVKHMEFNRYRQVNPHSEMDLAVTVACTVRSWSAGAFSNSDSWFPFTYNT